MLLLKLIAVAHQSAVRPWDLSLGDCRRYGRHRRSYGFFSALGDLLVTGPTRTNVNDYRAIVVA